MLVVLGLTGATSVGKTTLAKSLVAYLRWRDYREPSPVLIGLSDPLIDMTMALLMHAGYGKEEAYHLAAEDRKTLVPLLGGKTTRRVEQTLGVEWLRDMISPTALVDIVAHKILKAQESAPADRCKVVLVTGIRSQNEVDLIHMHGGLVVGIQRPGFDYVIDHAIERPVTPDATVLNNGSIADGMIQLLTILRKLMADKGFTPSPVIPD